MAILYSSMEDKIIIVLSLIEGDSKMGDYDGMTYGNNGIKETLLIK